MTDTTKTPAQTTVRERFEAAPIIKLRGDWMDGAYTDESNCIYRVFVLDGRIFDLDYMEQPKAGPSSPKDAVLDIDADGTIGHPGSRMRFLPDDGQLERYGLVGLTPVGDVPSYADLEPPIVVHPGPYFCRADDYFSAHFDSLTAAKAWAWDKLRAKRLVIWRSPWAGPILATWSRTKDTNRWVPDSDTGAAYDKAEAERLAASGGEYA